MLTTINPLKEHCSVQTRQQWYDESGVKCAAVHFKPGLCMQGSLQSRQPGVGK